MFYKFESWKAINFNNRLVLERLRNCVFFSFGIARCQDDIRDITTTLLSTYALGGDVDENAGCAVTAVGRDSGQCSGICSGSDVRFLCRPIERGRRRGAVKRDVAESWQKRELLATLRQRWVLRRTKALIADQLPNKTDQVSRTRALAESVTEQLQLTDHGEGGGGLLLCTI